MYVGWRRTWFCSICFLRKERGEKRGGAKRKMKEREEKGREDSGSTVRKEKKRRRRIDLGPLIFYSLIDNFRGTCNYGTIAFILIIDLMPTGAKTVASQVNF